MAYKERERKNILLLLQELEKGKETDPSWEISQLTELDLHFRWITSLPSSISRCSNLQYLDLSVNNLTHLPDSISQLKHLRRFYLKHNNFTKFPAQMCSLRELETLNMSSNKLASLHPDVIKLTNLKSLVLRSNQFTEIPAEIYHIPELEKLYMDENKISSVHPDIMKMTKLRHLYLNKNQFTEIPAEIYHIPELETLYMNENKISSVHPDVMKMTKLTNLNLSKNQFTEIPAEIYHIPELETLEMNENKISSVHPDVMKMTKLTNLYLSKNQFKEFPAEVCKIQSLWFLDMSYNSITHLPHQLLELEHLACLRVQGNPLVPSPMRDLLHKEDIHHYLASMRGFKGLEEEGKQYKGIDAGSSGSSSKGSKLASSLDKRQAGQSMSDASATSASSTTPKPAEKLLQCKVPDFINKELLEKITRDLVPREIREEMGAAIQKYSVFWQHNYPQISRISISRLQANGNGEKKPCIAVYCSDITNMARFPKELEGFPVEVREGTFSLSADNEGSRDDDHSQLYIGCSVGLHNSQGSLGVFVNHHIGDQASTKPQAFVTCSHVVCPYGSSPETATESPVYVENNRTLKRCGVVSKCYAGDVGFDSKKYGVDIALVELHKNAKANLFPIQSQLTSFSNVKIADVCHLRDPILVHKFGKTTGLTHGFVSSEYDYCCNTSLIDGTHGVPKPFSNMITVLSIPNLDKATFSEKGDSGAAVYVELENDKRVIIGTVVGSARDTSGEVPVQCSIVSRIHPSLHQIQACLYKPSQREEEPMETDYATGKLKNCHLS